MNKLTEIKLKESIEHWERLLKHTVERQVVSLLNEGWHDGSCALCKLYLTNNKHPCRGCPIPEYSGIIKCINTPWADAGNCLEHITGSYADKEDWEECVAYVTKELEYLKKIYNGLDPNDRA